MEIKTRTGDLLEEKTNAAIILCFESGAPEGLAAWADKALGGVIARAFKSGEFTGKPGQTLFFHSTADSGPERFVLSGMGKKDQFKPVNLMNAFASACTFARRQSMKELTASPEQVEALGIEEAAEYMTQAAVLALYTFHKLKKAEPDRKEISKLTFVAGDKKAESMAKEGVKKGRIIAESVNFSRDMTNAPGNEQTPTQMALHALEAGKEARLKVKVLEAADCKKLGMGSFLGVARGSKEPPKFIIMEYMGGDKNQAPVVLVGKGITFDSGGISIKPVEGMEKMKYDMAGGAAVIGAMRAAGLLKLPVNVIGIVPATENMPGGAALKPGDVVRAMNDKTTEIISTDAEGRLILADALCYTERYKPRAIIDIATLTGACVIALGDMAIGMMGNNAELIDAVRKAGEATHERVWELPMWDEFLDLMKGSVTDLKNVGGRPAATISAGKYLEEFVPEGTPWVHLDIAGTAWEEKGKPYLPKGARGTGVRLLVEYLKALK